MIQTTISTSSLKNAGVGQTPTSKMVTDSSTEIVAANSNRTALYLFNLGREDVWISCDASAVLGEGPPLSSGGSMLVDATAFTIGAINGVVKGNKSSMVTFQEFVR